MSYFRWARLLILSFGLVGCSSAVEEVDKPTSDSAIIGKWEKAEGHYIELAKDGTGRTSDGNKVLQIASWSFDGSTLTLTIIGSQGVRSGTSTIDVLSVNDSTLEFRFQGKTGIMTKVH